MPKYLLSSLLLCLPLLLLSQKTYVHDAARDRPTPQLSLFQKLVPDTTASDPFFEDCSNEVVTYPADGGGFVFGTNASFDLVKLQRIRYELGKPYLVTGVLVAFDQFDANIADTYIDVSIFDDLRPDSTFGALLGTSDSIRVGDLRVDDEQVLFTTFTFAEPVRVEADSFLVAINLARTYDAPGTGYLNILATQAGCGSGTNVFEIFPFENQLIFTDIKSSWNLDAEMFILVAIETDLNTSTRQPLAEYRSQIAPNPTDSYFQLSYQSSGNQPFTATLTDLTGRTLFIQRSTTISGRNTFDWDVSTLPTGLYLYHLDGPAGRQSGKVVKR